VPASIRLSFSCLAIGWEVAVMAGGGDQTRELRNDTAVNVAGLLKAQVGATRTYRLHLDALEADEETVAREIEGRVRLTRLRDAVMASVTASGVAQLECVRCLREYEQPFAVAFDEEFRQTVDVRTGLDLDLDSVDDGQVSWIDENHELDLREPLRQEILVALPMRPDCGADCPGPDQVVGDNEDVVDERLAALANLLGDDQTSESSARTRRTG
jgi:uncharacterized protein